jgi:hypothetical protein
MCVLRTRALFYNIKSEAVVKYVYKKYNNFVSYLCDFSIDYLDRIITRDTRSTG